MKCLQLHLRVLCAMILAAIPGASSLPNPGAGSTQGLRAIELQVHQDVNREREAERLAGLTWNEPLAAEARRHARNMVSRGFFAHEDPVRGDIESRLDRSHIEWIRCAENLYEQRGGSHPAKQAVKEWLHSPTHRRNMLDPTLRETGVGVAMRRDGTIVIVQEFLLRGV